MSEWWDNGEIGYLEWEIDGSVGNMGSVELVVRLNLRWLSVSATCLIIKDLAGCFLPIYPHYIKFSDNFHQSQYSHTLPVYQKKRVNYYF